MHKLYSALMVGAILLCTSAATFAEHSPDLYGAITQIDYNAKTFVVADVTVYTTAETVVSIDQALGTFDMLVVGQTVKVFGEEVDGLFVAKKICAPVLIKLDCTKVVPTIE